MKKTKEISENEMIAEFLLAEISSSSFGGDLLDFLAQTSYDEDLIRKPNLNDHDENDARKLVLGYRGYPDLYLFSGLPDCNNWYTAQFSNKDFGQIKTINYGDWISDTNGTRDFNVLAKKIRNNEIANPKIIKICADYDSGKKLPIPILIKDLSNDNIIVMEGNSRMAALAMLKMDKFEAIIGEMNNLNGWQFK